MLGCVLFLLHLVNFNAVRLPMREYLQNKLWQLGRAQPAKVGVGVTLGLAALAWRFRYGTPEQAMRVQTAIGFWWMWGVFIALVWTTGIILRRANCSVSLIAETLRKHKAGVAVVALSSVFLHLHEPHEFKVFYDEPSHLEISQVMYLNHEACAAVQSQYIGDIYVVMHTYPQFRQCFFPFAMYLVHTIAGYTPNAPFIVNTFTTVALLGALYWYSTMIVGRFGALVSVLLMTAVPLLAQNVTSAGYDPFNLLFLVLLFAASCKILNCSDDADALIWLNWGTAVCLAAAQVRYESILYFGLILCVIGIRFVLRRRLVVTWFLASIPVFLLPAFASNLYYLKTAVFQNTERRVEGEAFLGVEYLFTHLQDLLVYLYKYDSIGTSSLLVSVLGTLGVTFLVVRLIASKGMSPAKRFPLSMFCLAACFVFGVYCVTIMHYWSSPLDGLAARFTLPMWLCLAVAGGWLLAEFEGKPRVCSAALVLLAASIVANTGRANALHVTTSQLTPSKSERWFIDFAKTRERATTLFVSRSGSLLMDYMFASIDFSEVNSAPDKCLRAIQAGIYKELYILERDEYPSVKNPSSTRMLVDPRIVVEEVARRSFGPGEIARILKFVGYRTQEGKVVKVEDLPPIPAPFESEAKRDAFISSRYP